MSDFIVLGTDTDAGKTTFSALWLAAFAERFEYWKPVETGESDAAKVAQLVPSAVVHPPAARFREPVAPPLAAEREGRRCPAAKEIAGALPMVRVSGRGLLIETFGSPLSPLTESELQIELIRALNRPLVLVASSAVGAIGRTLQALAALRQYPLTPAAVALIGPEDGYAVAEIEKHAGGVRVFSLTPPARWEAGAFAESAARQQETLATMERVVLSQPLRAAPVRVPSATNAHANAANTNNASANNINADLTCMTRTRHPDGCRSQELLAADRRCVWHPYTSLRPSAEPLPVVAAEAEFLQLADGRRVIDAISSWWTVLHGHRHPPLMRLLRDAAERIDHVLFAGVTHPGAVRFAERILRTAPWPGGRVFFSDNGSTAVEVALKMAYQLWCHRGEPRRRLFVGFEHGYHGDTFGAMAVGRDRLFFGHFEPLLFQAAQLPVDPDQLDDWLKTRRHEVAAVIIEPLLQAAGGMRTHAPETLRDLFAVTKRHGVLFIADEVMTGNRTGRRWAYQHAGVAPDLICAAKTLAGGILPLAVTLASPEVVAAFDTDDRARTFFHGHSFTAHPLACELAALNEELVAEAAPHDRAAAIGRRLADELAPLREHPAVADVRRCGSVAAVELRAGGGYLATIGDAMRQRALERGVFLRPLGNVLYAMPPLCTSDESLARIADAMRAAVLLHGSANML
jgi:adenosylmethionine-8-amino-7-oxononanoate aminotransferase